MAEFTTTINDTQRVPAVVTVTASNGVDLPVTGLTLTQTSGDASFSMTAKDGTQLPVNQVDLVSGVTDGVSSWDVAIACGELSFTASIVLTVIAGTASVAIAFGVAEAK